MRDMTILGFTLFDTAVGQCALIWGENGVVGLQLPEANEHDTRARAANQFPDAMEIPPSGEAQQAIDGVTALLRGEPADLSAIRLDMSASPLFHRRVYEAARGIPRGSTLSYGEIARRIGSPGAARAVGQALGRNPFAVIVPCHRVIAAGGKTGGFSANGGVDAKLRLLAIEGAVISKDASVKGATAEPPLFPSDAGCNYDPAAAVARLRAADSELGKLIDKCGPFGLKIKPPVPVFAALAEAIIHQQLAGKAAAAIHERFCALFPGSLGGPTAEQILCATDEQLRGAGLSRPKLLAIRDLARKTADGDIPTLAEMRHQDDGAIIERLTTVRGVGRWTVEMLLIFRLGRPDVLPLDDYAIRKGYAMAFGLAELPAPKEVAARGERWKPYRSVASWFLWRVLALDKV
jgi:methylated-DNA-[protein]-cysteine S-methyltransferase